MRSSRYSLERGLRFTSVWRRWRYSARTSLKVILPLVTLVWFSAFFRSSFYRSAIRNLATVTLAVFRVLIINLPRTRILVKYIPDGT